MPDYSLYAVTIFFRCTNEPAGVRQLAGLLLKDYIKLQVLVTVDTATKTPLAHMTLIAYTAVSQTDCIVGPIIRLYVWSSNRRF